MFRFPPLTPFVKKLLIALVGLFIVTAVFDNFIGWRVSQLLALDPRFLTPLSLLQLFTHVFVLLPVPGAVFSLALSCVFIWWILAPFEDRYGATRIMQLIVVAAVGAGLCAIVAGQLLPGLAAPIAGPHTITLAAICAYAVLLPRHAEVSFFGLFPMRPQHLVLIVVAMSVLNFLTTRNAAALLADMGAVGGGIAFVKWWMQKPPPRKRKAPSRKPPKLRVVRRNDDDDPKSWLN